MRKTTIVFVELGMLGGIVLAGYTLPGSTPLWIFIVASVLMFVSGNALLLKRKRDDSNSTDAAAAKNIWPRLFRILVVLAVLWILGLIARR